jgi:MoaD family protein
VPAVRVLFFARARETAGRRDDELDAGTLGELLRLARERYGPAFGAVLDASRVWVNGDEPEHGDATALSTGDEVAVLPPVSGGAVVTARDSLNP